MYKFYLLISHTCLTRSLKVYEPKPNSVVPQKVLNYMMKISVLFTSLLLSGTKTYAYGVGSSVAGDFVVKSFVQQNFIVCHEEMKTEA